MIKAKTKVFTPGTLLASSVCCLCTNTSDTATTDDIIRWFESMLAVDSVRIDYTDMYYVTILGKVFKNSLLLNAITEAKQSLS